MCGARAKLRYSYPLDVRLGFVQPKSFNALCEPPTKSRDDPALDCLVRCPVSGIRHRRITVKMMQTDPPCPCRRVTNSSICITLVNSRFLVLHWRILPTGSTSLSSMTHDSDREIMFFAHRGSAPRFKMSLVVSKDPEGVNSRETTSQEMMWEAYGFGYRRK